MIGILQSSRKSAPLRRVGPSTNIFDPHLLEETFLLMAKEENEKLERKEEATVQMQDSKEKGDFPQKEPNEKKSEEQSFDGEKKDSFARGSMLLSLSQRSLSQRKSAYLPNVAAGFSFSIFFPF